MEIEKIRVNLKNVFENNSLTKGLLNSSHIIVIVTTLLMLLSNISSLGWLSFGGATLLICEISLIFTFVAKKYKFLYVGIILLLVDRIIALIMTFLRVRYYYNLGAVIANIIGQIVVVLIFIFIYAKVFSFVKSTGDMNEMREMFQSGMNQFSRQVNSGMQGFEQGVNQFQNNMNGYQNENQAINSYYENSPEYRPISPLGYIGYFLLFSIPLVGFILLIVFSFGGTQNKNVKNFARSYFCFFIISIIVILLIVIIGGTGFLSYFNRRYYY